MSERPAERWRSRVPPILGAVAVVGKGDDARLVLFDLDNTLIDRAAGFRAWCHRFLSERQLDPAAITWLDSIDDDGVKSRDTFFAEICARWEFQETADQLAQDYRALFPWLIPPPASDTFEALRRLRDDGWRVGIVTNGSPAQEKRITSSGLASLVDGWVVSGVVGARKPDPAIFLAAAEKCGASLKGGWMVGDRAEADVAGAIACGLSSVWISRGTAWKEPSFRPDVVSASVGEAVSAILQSRREPDASRA